MMPDVLAHYEDQWSRVGQWWDEIRDDHTMRRRERLDCLRRRERLDCLRRRAQSYDWPAVWDAAGCGPDERVVVRDGRYVRIPFDDLQDRHLLELDAHAWDFDVVVELGAGWGYNLLGIPWDDGQYDDDLPDLVACELTESGRLLAERVASDLGVELEVRHCDLTALDLSWLDEYPGRKLVFTCQSIEQVPFLPAATLAELDRHADEVWHFEPTGWQRYRWACQDFADDSIRPADIGTGRHLSARAEHHAERMDHNRNLLRLLDDRSPHYLWFDAYSNSPYCPLSIIKWRTGR